MIKILLLLLSFVPFTVLGQDVVEVKIDVNRELYPVHEEDAYKSSDSYAMIGVTYMDAPYNQAIHILDIMKVKVKLQEYESIDLTGSRTAVTGVEGIVLDDFGEKMCIELYVLEANEGQALILIMSGYK